MVKRNCYEIASTCMCREEAPEVTSNFLNHSLLQLVLFYFYRRYSAVRTTSSKLTDPLGRTLRLKSPGWPPLGEKAAATKKVVFPL